MYSESASPKDHFCEVLLKSVMGFRGEDFFLSNYSRTDNRQTDGPTDRCRTLINHNSSP